MGQLLMCSCNKDSNMTEYSISQVNKIYFYFYRIKKMIIQDQI